MTTSNKPDSASNTNRKQLWHTKVPPDGGWGWIVVIGYSLFNLILLPMLTNFCLIYKDKINAIDLTAAEISVIFNFNSAFGLSLGLIANKMLRLFGCRLIACISAAVFVLGTGLTSLANSFWTFFLTYSIISAFGYGFGTTSFSMSMNRYFIKNRNRAAGIAMTVTGIGPIIYPPIIVILNEMYSVNGCILILSAMSGHMIVAALLLQPVRWHLISIPSGHHDTITIINQKIIKNISDRKTSASEYSDDDMVDLPTNLNKSDFFMIHHNVYGTYEPIPIRRKLSLPLPYVLADRSSSSICDDQLSSFESPEFDEFTRVKSIESIYDFKETSSRRWFESGSLDSIHLGSSLQIFNEKFYNNLTTTTATLLTARRESRRPSMHVTSLQMVREESDNDDEDEQQATQLNDLSKNLKKELEQINEKLNNNNNKHLRRNNGSSISDSSTIINVKKWLNKNYDISLLKDKIYLNIMFGVSLAGFAEFNFIVFTPMILEEMNFGIVQICSVMSMIGSTDILFRFVAPFIGDYFHQPPRIMFMITLILLISSRMAILFVSSYAGVLFVGAAIGIARGVRTVYWNLVIPNYVPIEQLPSATTIQIIVNGIILIIMGPIIGLLVDATGSFTICVILLNVITLVTIISWLVEMLVHK